MAKLLEISYPHKNVTANFELYERLCPQTVAAVWEATKEPYEVPSYHSIFSGQEIFWYIPQELSPDLPLENHSWRCDPGDLFYFYMKGGQLKKRGQTPQLQKSMDVFELAIPYGLSDFQIMTLDGWRGSIIGKIIDNHDAFFKACGSVLDEGIKNVRVRRVER